MSGLRQKGCCNQLVLSAIELGRMGKEGCAKYFPFPVQTVKRVWARGGSDYRESSSKRER